MKEVKLTHGKVAIVDDDILDKVIRFQDLEWHAVRSKSGVWHATCTLAMHRLVVNTPEDSPHFVFAPGGKVVDHGDRDGLNNLRTNLTVTTACGNAANRAQKKSSKYKGVTCVARKKQVKYRAYYTHEGKYCLVGHFNDELTAARMRDDAVKKVFGDAADLNFPEQKGKEDGNANNSEGVAE